MTRQMAFIGFGEAATAFAGGIALPFAAYDRKVLDATLADAKREDILHNRGTAASGNAEAVSDAAIILSLVTADQALLAAEETAKSISPGALYYDMNSVAPDTKRQAAKLIEAAGGRYVDVAVMSPVHPSRLNVPLLVSGPHAISGSEILAETGFRRVRVVDGDVGRASSIKMIRSVVVKGIEALTVECVLAADRAGVLDEVIASLDASPAPADWSSRADYNLDRMMIHGLRRAAEMEEVVKTLDSLGTGSMMTRGTVQRQRAIGSLGLSSPPEQLALKLAALSSSKAEAA